MGGEEGADTVVGGTEERVAVGGLVSAVEHGPVESGAEYQEGELLGGPIGIGHVEATP